MKKEAIENHIRYGLDSVDETRTVEVNLKSLLLMYKTTQELISFFHQRGHYKNIEDIHKYMGNKKSGMLSILFKINYQDYENLLPQEVKSILESDEIYSSLKQYYKKK
jgi:hypothetical protein